MDGRLVVAGVALAVGFAATPAKAQELTFTSSATCKLDRGCNGFFMTGGAQGALTDLDEWLRARKESSSFEVSGTIQLFARVIPSEENGWQCGPDRADVLRKLGLPPDEGCDDPEPDPDPDPVVTPEPATLILLATGLAGVGGAAIRRRRRQR